MKSTLWFIGGVTGIMAFTLWKITPVLATANVMHSGEMQQLTLLALSP